MMRFLIFFILFAAACGKPASTPPASNGTVADEADVIARVDDRVLRVGDLRAIDPAGTLTADEISSVTENWVEKELLMKVAGERGVLTDTTVQWRVDQARSEIVLGALGEVLRRETSAETEAKSLLRKEVEAMRKKSRVESNPWRVK
ncbi:MAG: hypothetical protein AAB229_10035 [Candidatus Hydrogenedentota bacterium]